MRVHVKLFAGLPSKVSKTIQSIDPNGIRAGFPLDVDLPDESTIGDLITHLELSRDLVLTTFVNGKVKKPDTKLNQGDQVGIFPPIGGG